jgi:two-component system cell cycle sensor histidine kinase/response regulator CckA
MYRRSETSMAPESPDDTTRRLRMQAERDEAKRQYRQLFDNDLSAIAVLSEAGIILKCNRALVKLLNAEAPGDLVGRSFARFLEDPSHLGKLLSTVGVEGRVDAVELQARRVDDDAIVLGARLDGDFAHGGQLVSVQLLLLEMTDRRRLEAHIVGVQRTEAVGRLAGGLAHDFNNLLTVIGGHADYLVQTLPDDTPERSSAESILEASHRAAALTRQLLAFGRRQVFHLQVVDIRRFLDEARPTLARVVGERIELRIEVNDAAPEIEADPAQLEEVLVNLALNARGALTEGGTLTIRADRMDIAEQPPRERPWLRRGTYLQIGVSDSGPGMDEGVRARVFEPFYTTRHLGRGVGLGLATVYGIVKQSDGYIWVDSEVGNGTAFTMLLPARDAVTPGMGNDVASNAAPHETVLLVERAERLRALLADALRRNGYYVLDVDSAARATELFAVYAGRIALVVAEVEHVDGSGTAIAERLRAIAPRLRVLYMSARSTAVLSAPPGDGFIQKPFSLQAFADCVRQVLAGNPPAGSRS